MKTSRNIFKEAYVLLSIVIIVLSTVVVTADTVNNVKQVVLLEENFEEGVMPPTDWTVTSNEWSISTDAMYGNYSAKFYDPTHSKTESLISPDLTYDVADVYISFWYKNPDGLDTLTVSVSYGGPWYLIAEYSDPVEQYTLYHPITEIIFGSLKIKFTVASGGGEGIYLDYIIVSNTNANYPPYAPTITGTSNGKPDTSYDYTFITTDPNEDKIHYYVDWGDNSKETLEGPYESGEPVTVSHTYTEKGTYNIKAKAIDQLETQSRWGTFEVSIAKNKAINTPLFLQKLIQHFPFLEKILNLQYN